MLAEKAVNAQNYSYVRVGQFHDWWDTGQYHNADYSTMRIFTVGSNSAWFGPDDYTFLGDGEERPAAWVQGTVDEGYARTRELGFGSAHPGNTNAVMGDGSTHSLSDSADAVVLIRLGQRADGALASIEDL